MRLLTLRGWWTALLLVGTPWVSAQNNAPPESVNLRHTVTVEVVQKTKDAVVNISTTRFIAQQRLPFGNPFFQEFGGMGDVVRVPAASLGSGFIIHADGYVVTNHHVIDRARQINVELADGRKLPADLISSDPEADVAILKVQADKPLPTLSLGDSSDLMIGEPVIAVGNPLGFSHSVSTGIVSALHRDLKGGNGQPNDKVLLGDLIQTDAAINPGNSGGPLLNAYGQVIGINTAIRGDAQNIGFSIPVNKLRSLIKELMNPEVANRVRLKGLPGPIDEVRTLRPPASIDTKVVITGKGASMAKGSSTVAKINGRHPVDVIDAYAILLHIGASDKEATIELEDGSKQKYAVEPVPIPDAIVHAKDVLGLTIEPLTPMLAEKYSLQTDDGLLVRGVAKNSIASKAGIEPGDVVTQLGRYRVATLKDFAALLDRLPTSGKVRIGVIRNGQLGVGVLDFGG